MTPWPRFWRAVAAVFDQRWARGETQRSQMDSNGRHLADFCLALQPCPRPLPLFFPFFFELGLPAARRTHDPIGKNHMILHVCIFSPCSLSITSLFKFSSHFGYFTIPFRTYLPPLGFRGPPRSRFGKDAHGILIHIASGAAKACFFRPRGRGFSDPWPRFLVSLAPKSLFGTSFGIPFSSFWLPLAPFWLPFGSHLDLIFSPHFPAAREEQTINPKRQPQVGGSIS